MHLDELPDTLATELATDGKTLILGSADGERRMPPSIGRRLRWDAGATFCLDDPPPAPGSVCTDIGNGGLTFDGILDEPINMLLLNVMTARDRDTLKDLPPAAEPVWNDAVDALYSLTRNPYGLKLYDPLTAGCSVDDDQHVTDCAGGREWKPDLGLLGFLDEDDDGVVDPARTLGSGSALTAGFAPAEGFVTLAFNNDPSLGAAPVSLRVIKVGCLNEMANRPPAGTYQGQIHVIAPENVFDEQVTLRHSGDFAGNPDDLLFEWYSRADIDGTPPLPLPVAQDDTFGWTYSPQSGAGAFEITVGGTNPQTLEDTWYLSRYKGLPVCGNGAGEHYSAFAGQPGGTLAEQRAQLSEGWVKRVLGQINPFEQKVKDFHRTAVDTTASMLSQLGGRFEGPVALNSDPANLNSLGLIETYETILQRAMDLSVNASPPTATPAALKAILLVATRLADFYMLLGNEAWADAQDPTIGITTDAELGSIASSLFNFQNQVASVLEEELVLLRGRDNSQASVTSKPVYNRFFWNLTTGEGEIAYSTSYNLFDADFDGTIDAFDALIQFPQGQALTPAAF